MTPDRAARRHARRLRLWGGLAAFLVLGLSLLWVAREPLLIAAARALTVDDAEAPADYLVVLGGHAETRPFAAAALYRQGFAPKVLIFRHSSEPITDLGPPTGDEVYQKVLELEGVPPSAIEQVPMEVDSSWDEAGALQRFLASHPARRIILVTSAEHTRRARWIFRKVLAGMPVEVRTAPARHLGFDETDWWKHDDGVLVYLHEYLKLPVYWVRATLRFAVAAEPAR